MLALGGGLKCDLLVLKAGSCLPCSLRVLYFFLSRIAGLLNIFFFFFLLPFSGPALDGDLGLMSRGAVAGRWRKPRFRSKSRRTSRF